MHKNRGNVKRRWLCYLLWWLSEQWVKGRYWESWWRSDGSKEELRDVILGVETRKNSGDYLERGGKGSIDLVISLLVVEPGCEMCHWSVWEVLVSPGWHRLTRCLEVGEDQACVCAAAVAPAAVEAPRWLLVNSWPPPDCPGFLGCERWAKLWSPCLARLSTSWLWNAIEITEFLFWAAGGFQYLCVQR